MVSETGGRGLECRVSMVPRRSRIHRMNLTASKNQEQVRHPLFHARRNFCAMAASLAGPSRFGVHGDVLNAPLPPDEVGNHVVALHILCASTMSPLTHSPPTHLPILNPPARQAGRARLVEELKSRAKVVPHPPCNGGGWWVVGGGGCRHRMPPPRARTSWILCTRARADTDTIRPSSPR